MAACGCSREPQYLDHVQLRRPLDASAWRTPAEPVPNGLDGHGAIPTPIRNNVPHSFKRDRGSRTGLGVQGTSDSHSLYRRASSNRSRINLMKIEWMLLAEGIGQDAKGALTL